MVQVRLKVGTAQNGSMNAVAGSGIASMSEASMLFQPRMEEPSKPRPSEKESSFSSAMGMLKCCQVPKVSTNLMSTIFAPAFLANSNTLLGVLMFSLSFVWLFVVSADKVKSCAGADFRQQPAQRRVFFQLTLMVTFL